MIQLLNIIIAAAEIASGVRFLFVFLNTRQTNLQFSFELKLMQIYLLNSFFVLTVSRILLVESSVYVCVYVPDLGFSY